jgi:hypothetical protein
MHRGRKLSSTSSTVDRKSPPTVSALGPSDLPNQHRCRAHLHRPGRRETDQGWTPFPLTHPPRKKSLRDAVVRDAQARSHVIARRAPVRKRGKALAVGNDRIRVSLRHGRRSGLGDVFVPFGRLVFRLRREHNGAGSSRLVDRFSMILRQPFAKPGTPAPRAKATPRAHRTRQPTSLWQPGLHRPVARDQRKQAAPNHFTLRGVLA